MQCFFRFPSFALGVGGDIIATCDIYSISSQVAELSFKLQRKHLLHYSSSSGWVEKLMQQESESDAASQRLIDTQISLATALARVEAHRCRERFLYRENQALRGALLQAGVSPVQLQDVVRTAVSAAKDVGDPHLRGAFEAPAAAPAAVRDAGDVLHIAPLAAGQPVHYFTPDGKVWPFAPAQPCAPSLLLGRPR